MRKIFFFMLIIIINPLYAQKVIPVNISYFGETITNPGFETSYENNFLKGFNFTISAGFYVHQRNHTALFLNGGINWRHTFPIGYSIEFGAGLGYLQTWTHGGDVYNIDDNGNVFVKQKTGRANLMPLLKLGVLGWDFRESNDIPIRINVDVIFFGQYPFNNFMMPHFALKTGATYYFEINEN